MIRHEVRPTSLFILFEECDRYSHTDVLKLWTGIAHADAAPNGLAFSCRERAADHLQKANDLAREAVNCNAGLGGAGG
jgi:hypothetical protein